jgi:hypothetical protein
MIAINYVLHTFYSYIIIFLIEENTKHREKLKIKSLF